MIIEIISDSQFVVKSNEAPEIGRFYSLEDAETGTGAQNRYFHALLTEYWCSGKHSYQVKDFETFRNLIKLKLGAGFESYIYVMIERGKPVIKDAKTKEDIPESVRRDPDLKTMARGMLKSWSDYTKTERRDTINRLITEMIESGVSSKRFDDLVDCSNRCFN